MQSIKLYCENGLFRWHRSETEPTVVRTICNTYDEDTINAHLPIPPETELEVVKCYQCLYGTFIDVNYNGKIYSIKPKYVEVI